MQVTGKFLRAFETQTGMGRNGEWKKRAFLVETEGQYPKTIYVTIWGDKINLETFQVGQIVKVDFDAESKEFGGRWYTELRAWRVEVAVNDIQPFDLKPETFNDDQALLNISDDDILPF